MKITKKIANLTKSLLSRKSRLDLDNDGKIETYREEIQGVFSQFKRMNDKLEDVNTKLKGVIAEELEVAEKAKERIEKATAEINANGKLQEKVQEFIR